MLLQLEKYNLDKSATGCMQSLLENDTQQLPVFKGLLLNKMV